MLSPSGCRHFYTSFIVSLYILYRFPIHHLHLTTSYQELQNSLGAEVMQTDAQNTDLMRTVDIAYCSLPPLFYSLISLGYCIKSCNANEQT